MAQNCQTLRIKYCQNLTIFNSEGFCKSFDNSGIQGSTSNVDPLIPLLAKDLQKSNKERKNNLY
mgnify:CR=1 FL=1